MLGLVYPERGGVPQVNLLHQVRGLGCPMFSRVGSAECLSLDGNPESSAPGARAGPAVRCRGFYRGFPEACVSRATKWGADLDARGMGTCSLALSPSECPSERPGYRGVSPRVPPTSFSRAPQCLVSGVPSLLPGPWTSPAFVQGIINPWQPGLTQRDSRSCEPPQSRGWREGCT